MIKLRFRKLLLFAILIFFTPNLSTAQIPDYDVSSTALGGVLNYFSERPSGFLANPANLGLNAWQRTSIHLNAPYQFNEIVFNGFRPRIGHVGIAFTRSFQNTDVQSFRAGLSKIFGSHVTWGVRLDYSKFTENKRLFMNWGTTYRFTKFTRSGSPIQIGFGAHISHINILNQAKEPLEWGAGGFLSLNQDQIKIYPNFFVKDKKSYWGLGSQLSLVESFALLFSISNRPQNRFCGGLSLKLDRYITDLIFNPKVKRLQVSFSVLFGESPGERAEKYFNNGKHALEAHKFKEARVDFKKAWCYVPENNFYKRSYELVTRKIRNENNQIQKWMSDAQQLEQRGYFFVAAMRYLDILNQNPDYAPAKYRLKALHPLVRNDIKQMLLKGKHYLNEGQESIAEKIFQKILLIDKENNQARDLLAKIHRSKRKEAEEYFYRGLGYYSQRNLTNAQEQFEKALQIDSSYQEVKVYLDEIQRKNNQKLAKVDSLLNQSHELEKKKHFTRALDDYLRVLDLDHDNQDAKAAVLRLNKFVKKQDTSYLKKSRAALRRKDFATAERYVNRILRISPKNRNARRLKNQIDQAKITLFNEFVDKGDAQLQAQHLRAALDNYQKARLIFPRNKKLNKTVEMVKNKIELEKNLKAGIFAFNSQKYNQAIGYFTRVLDAQPANEIAANYLKASREKIAGKVKSLLQKGIEMYSKEDYQDAIQIFSNLLKLDPGNSIAREYYNRSLIKQKTIQNLQKK